MGWRAWKAFYAHISQDIMQDMMVELATPYPDPDGGGMVALKDLGYLYVGLDDHWQNCTTVCANGTVVPSWAPWNGDYDYQCCHAANGTCENDATTLPWYSDGTDGRPYGTPIWDTHRFPDVAGMVTKAHSLGLRAGWYMVRGEVDNMHSACTQPTWRVSIGTHLLPCDILLVTVVLAPTLISS